MIILCLLRFNVLLSVLISALIAGLVAQVPMLETMNTLINGMKGNLQTALSYILLGAIAAAISKTNLTAFLIKIVSHFISHKKYLLILSLALIACFSQNLVPIHVAFVPILIPPLLTLFNKLKIDRRGVACALTFGLTTPYMVLPLGFGLIFQNLLVDNLNQNGVAVNLSDVTSTMFLAAFCMLFGLLLSIFIFYSKPREYQEIAIKNMDYENIQMTRKEWGVLGGVSYKKVDLVFDDGLKMMGFIAFVMLVAAGYGEVLKQSGAVEELVNSVIPFVEGNKFLAIFAMLFIGLIIGTSFGTIPIIATLFCPICLELGFSASLIIFIIGTFIAMFL